MPNSKILSELKGAAKSLPSSAVMPENLLLPEATALTSWPVMERVRGSNSRILSELKGAAKSLPSSAVMP